MLRSLTYFWRMNLAVMAGAAVASAVLTGALLVGDSVRGSLRELTLERLGAIDHALAGQRFFKEDVVERLRAEVGAETVAPAILLQGTVQHARTRTRATEVSLQGVGETFLELFPDDAGLLDPLFATAAGITPPAVINESLARELGAAVGDALLFHLKRWSDVPRGSLLGRKDTGSVVQTVRLEVVAIVPDRGVGRFGLSVHQALPLNVFVPLAALQKALRQPDEVNGVLVAGDAEGLDDALRRSLTAADLGLLLSEHDGYVAIESEEFILKPALEPVIERLANDSGAATLPLLTYLVNRIDHGDRTVPYSTVTALDLADAAAFGGLLLVDGSPAAPLRDGEILLNEWTAEELGAEEGYTVELTYFVVGPREDLREESATFVVRGVTRIAGLGADPTLSQGYPGIADSDNMGDWDPPFPIDLGAIRPRDEDYWDEHRGTPKAFVALATGQRLWRTRWGQTTAVRVRGEGVLATFRDGLVAAADLGAYGLAFRPVKSLGLEASGGATDFGALFGFLSVFLIASAAMLAALLFSLGVEQRVGEVGLRQAVGEPPARVRRRLLAEGGVLAAVGALAGLAGAVGYAALMMHGLRTWWQPAVGTSRLELHVGAGSLAGGYVGALLVVLFAIWWTLRRFKRLSAPQLLAREVEPVDTRPGRAARWTAAIALPLAGLLLAVAVVTGQTTKPTFFFVIGPALLVGALALYALRIAGSARLAKKNALRRPGLAALFQMAALNSGRNRRRSLLAATLVASACFLIVTVASYQEGFTGELGRDSGTGGFRLVAESAIPLYQDLGTSAGRFELGLDGDAVAGVEVVPLRLLPGDDTSCLNLYQPEQPRVLGVPHELVERGGFRFNSTVEEVENPWTLLERDLDEPGVIPAFGDVNSTQWILKLPLGEDLEMEDENGETVRLRLVGTLKTSIFQSELLISEDNFKKHFSSQSGFSYFLIDVPAERADDVTQYLESGLDAYGFDAVSAAEKLASFHAVQNTYLATFQTIGGLGLLLGTIGLAVVLARNVIERRKELATLRAFGFRHAVLTRMVVLENALLLVWGLGIGTVAALLTAGPHILEEAEYVPWASIAGTLAVILVFGLVACSVAARRALKASLVPALKSDR